MSKVKTVAYRQVGTIWYILFYIVGLLNPIWRSSKCTSRREAQRKRPEMEKQLLAELDGTAEPPPPPPPPPVKAAARSTTKIDYMEKLQNQAVANSAAKNSVIMLLIAILQLIGAKVTKSSRYGNERAAVLIVDALEQRAYVDRGVIKGEDWAKIRQKLDHDVNDASRRQVAGILRRLTNELITRGLPGECLHQLSNVQGKSQNEAAGEPFWGEHIRLMFQRLKDPQEPDIIHGLVCLGLSSGAQMIDVGSLEYDEMDRKTGLVQRYRVKVDDARVTYVLLPCALDWINKRYKPGDIYVFPELVYKQAEQKLASCNTVRVDIEDRKKRISTIGTTLFAGFMKRAGITSPDLSFKSFRQHVVSTLSSQNVKERLRMRITGHMTSWSQGRYDFPADWEFLRARDVLDRHLQDILAGRQERYILTFTEVVDELEKIMLREMAAMDAKAQTRHVEAAAMFGIGYGLLHKILVLQHELERLQTERYLALATKVDSLVGQRTELLPSQDDLLVPYEGQDMYGDDEDWDFGGLSPSLILGPGPIQPVLPPTAASTAEQTTSPIS